MMNPGLGVEAVESAIKLIESAKKMGVQHFKLGDFEVTFAHGTSTIADYIDLKPGQSAVPASPLDDPDLWLHVSPSK
jgi:hypothetical protein